MVNIALPTKLMRLVKVQRAVVEARPFNRRVMARAVKEAVVRIVAGVERLVRDPTVSQILLEGAILLPIRPTGLQSLRFSPVVALVADVFMS